MLAVRIQLESKNRKLSPLRYESTRSGRARPVPDGPRCSSTYVSIAATCPESCRFRSGGCYVQAGLTGPLSRRLDDEAGKLDGFDVMLREAESLDAAFGGGPVPQDGRRGGRDLRLHVGGDVSCEKGARVLAAAAARWLERGGGRVWTYTHRWLEIPRSSFGPIQALASVEAPEDLEKARALGYVPSVVVDSFPDGKGRAFSLPRAPGWRALPCPAETRGRSCVECRLCLDTDALYERRAAIAFSLHGTQRAKVRLPVTRQLGLFRD